MTTSPRPSYSCQLSAGVVFQFFQLLPTLTLLEISMLPMDYCKVYSLQDRPKRAMELVERVDLAEQAHQLPASVSSGQQQSAAIARAVLVTICIRGIEGGIFVDAFRIFYSFC